MSPPESTPYRIADGQVIVPPTAAERRGVQPVPMLTVEGRDRADVAVGDTVTFAGTAEVPPGAGPVVEVEWDFDGSGQYPAKRTDTNGGEGHLSRVCHTVEHTFSEAGTYFPAMRVTSHREGRPDSLYGRIQNIARVRVVVHDPGS